MMVSIYASAYVEVDGIYYNLNESTKEAEVTYRSLFGSYKGKIVIPSSIVYEDVEYRVTSIDDFAFHECSSLTSIDIPNSVTSIGSQAFAECTSLTSITIPNSVTSISGYAFYGCTGLTSITIPNSVTSIGEAAFSLCEKLKTVRYTGDLESWLNIDCEDLPLYYAEYFFVEGNLIKDLVIPKGVTSIRDYAFSGYKGLSSVTIPYSVEKVEEYSFKCDKNYKIYCYPKLYNRLYSEYNSRVTLYGASSYEIFIYDKTQTTITISLKKRSFVPAPDDEVLTMTPYISFTSHPDNVLIDENSTYTITGLYPCKKIDVYAYTEYSDGYTFRSDSREVQTRGVITDFSANVASTSIEWICRLDPGDATLESYTITSNNCTTSDSTMLFTGLEPNTVYSCEVKVTCKEGGSETKTLTRNTSALTLETLKPKCVSSTSTIVAATTNISDAETSVGFQWKKYDAPESLAPNEGYAAIYDGQIEGYIKNMQPTYYNVRAFYKSASGNYYYGDWVTFDQTDFSYFEPTVHTYPENRIKDNTVSVRGYVLAGTDQIIEQGFEYWETVDPTNSRRVYASLAPDNNVQTVLASGQIMQAELKDLNPETTYMFRAFARTDYGTTYGEEQSFTTDFETGIISVPETDVKTADIVGYYDISGRRLPNKQRGINIIRYSDGTSRKLFIR